MLDRAGGGVVWEGRGQRGCLGGVGVEGLLGRGGAGPRRRGGIARGVRELSSFVLSQFGPFKGHRQLRTMGPCEEHLQWPEDDI